MSTEATLIASSKLHTFARRYCMERFSRWKAAYAKLRDQGSNKQGEEYSLKAYDLFPRYLLHQAILIELERLDSDFLPGWEDTRALLINIAETSYFQFTETPTEVAAWAINEEREMMVKALEALTPEQPVAPLWYRRILGKQEKTQVMKHLQMRWGVRPNGWYPLISIKDPTVVAFPYDAFLKYVNLKNVRKRIAARHIARVFEIQSESKFSYCLDTRLCIPAQLSMNAVWTSNNFDWVIYIAEQKTISLGGWITEEIKLLWEDWSKYGI